MRDATAHLGRLYGPDRSHPAAADGPPGGRAPRFPALRPLPRPARRDARPPRRLRRQLCAQRERPPPLLREDGLRRGLAGHGHSRRGRAPHRPRGRGGGPLPARTARVHRRGGDGIRSPPPRRDQPLRPHRHARTVPPRQPHVLLRAARHLTPQPLRSVPARAPGRARDPQRLRHGPQRGRRRRRAARAECAVFSMRARSALVTLWDVSDSSTSGFMARFYGACARRATTREPPSSGP